MPIVCGIVNSTGILCGRTKNEIKAIKWNFSSVVVSRGKKKITKACFRVHIFWSSFGVAGKNHVVKQLFGSELRNSVMSSPVADLVQSQKPVMKFWQSIDVTPYCIISDFMLLQNFWKNLYGGVTIREGSRSSVLFSEIICLSLRLIFRNASGQDLILIGLSFHLKISHPFA